MTADADDDGTGRTGGAGENARSIEVRRLGRTLYRDVLEMQRLTVDARIRGEVPDTLILTEHEPVVTVGRGARAADLEGVDVPVVEIERGGDATFHGPGQLVAYPILELTGARRDVHRYLRDLEEVVIGVLAELEVEGSRREGMTGVWIGERKVCSIGVALKRWVTYHGLALNLHVDLGFFQTFRPCGMSPDVMTRLADHAELPPTNLLGEVLLVKHFCRVFERDVPGPPPSEPRSPGAARGGSEGGFPPLPLLG